MAKKLPTKLTPKEKKALDEAIRKINEILHPRGK